MPQHLEFFFVSRGPGRTQRYALVWLLVAEQLIAEEWQAPVTTMAACRDSDYPAEWSLEAIGIGVYRGALPRSTAAGGESMRRAVCRLMEQGLVHLHQSGGRGPNFVWLSQAGRAEAIRLAAKGPLRGLRLDSPNPQRRQQLRGWIRQWSRDTTAG